MRANSIQTSQQSRPLYEIHRLCKLTHARKCKTPSCAAPVSFTGLPHEALDTDAFYGSIVGTNCENVVGYVPLPVGVVGPLIIDGRPMTVPLATTDSSLTYL